MTILNGPLLQRCGIVGLYLLVGGAIALPATGEIVFGLLGVTPEDPTWTLALVLGGLLTLIAMRLPLEQLRCGQPSLNRLGWLGVMLARLPVGAGQGPNWLAIAAMGLSRFATGSLLGFVHGGRWTGDDWRGAIAGLVVGLILAGVMHRWGDGIAGGFEPLLAGAIAFWAAYSLWLWLAAWGLSALMAQSWLAGGGYGLGALVFAQWAWSGLGRLCALRRYQMRRSQRTP